MTTITPDQASQAQQRSTPHDYFYPRLIVTHYIPTDCPLLRAILTAIPSLLHIRICDARSHVTRGRGARLALPVKALHVGQEDYWLDQIAKDREEYFSGKGESPLLAAGAGSGHLGGGAYRSGLADGPPRRPPVGADP